MIRRAPRRLPWRDGAGHPHITDEIKHFIRMGAGDAEVAICEIGGTVGGMNRCRSSRPCAR